MDSNPYQPPADGGITGPATSSDTVLATWAIWLSVIFGISPLGADLLVSASQANNPLYYTGLCLLFLVFMVAPLAMLFYRGGTRAFARTPIRITISCMIIAFYLIVHASAIARRL